MDFLSIAKNRYTTKKYNHGKRIASEKTDRLKEILRLSPSSINSQPWKFTFVSEENLKARFAEVSYFNEHKVKDASHLVIFSVIDDIAKFEKKIQDNLPEGNIAYYNQNIKPKREEEIKSWFAHQVYLSLGYFLSACASMEIDSTPMEGIDIKGYADILQLDGYKPLFAVAVGYRDPQDSNQPSITPKSRLDITEVITDN